MKIRHLLWFVGLFLLTVSCNTNKKEEKQAEEKSISKSKRNYEAISLLGDTLYTIDLPADQKKKYDSALQVAEIAYQENPEHLNNIIWLGRRLAYLHHYQDAIQVYTQGIQKHPNAPELFRHRGHRYITTRQFGKAIKDLEQSALLAENMPITLEPDGVPLPLPANHTPTSLQFNIYYHLGLAYFLSGDYGKAAQAYEKCLTYCKQEDEMAATADWLYMTYRRLGEDEIAEKTLDMIKEDMHIQDSEGYFERILMYKGLIEPDSLLQTNQQTTLSDHNLIAATHTYGIGSYYMMNGDTEKGVKVLHDVIDGRYWVAFGYIAAEADIARLQKEEVLP